MTFVAFFRTTGVASALGFISGISTVVFCPAVMAAPPTALSLNGPGYSLTLALPPATSLTTPGPIANGATNGLCVLDAGTDPADAGLLSNLQQTKADNTVLVAALAPCGRLDDWRRGKTTGLEHYSLILMPLRQGAVRALSATITRDGYLAAVQSEAPAMTWEALREAANATAISDGVGDSPASGSWREADAVFVPRVSRLRLGEAGVGKRVVRATVEGLTLIANLPLSVTTTQPWTATALDEALVQNRVIVAALSAPPLATPTAPPAAKSNPWYDYVLPLGLGLLAGMVVTRIAKRRRARHSDRSS